VWIPSAFNDNDHGLSFADPIFDPIAIAQTASQALPCPDPTVACIIQTSEPGNELIFHDAHHCLQSNVTPSFKPIVSSDDPIFRDAQEDLLPGALHFFEPSDNMDCSGFLEHAFHLSIDFDQVIDSTSFDRFLHEIDHAKLRGGHEEEFDSFAYVSHAAIQDQAER
jgi:hypothetical protein